MFKHIFTLTYVTITRRILNLFLPALALTMGVIGLAQATIYLAPTQEATMKSISMLDPAEVNNWIVVNDTVMGGRSRARLVFNEDHLVFSGDLSLRNNGGFASVRRVYQSVEWQAGKPMQISIRGDGRRYQFRLRTNLYADGVAFVKEFTTTAGEWQTISFVEADFTPQFRGRLVSRAKALDFSEVAQMGFMLADKQEGDFTLHIKKIAQ